MCVKMRTIGRHHWALRKLEDGKEHHHKVFRPITALSSRFLQDLLIRGLVRRSSRDVKKRATYAITELGLKALKQLDVVQSFGDIKDDMVTIYFDAPEGGKMAIMAGYPFIAKRGFQWIDVEVEINEYWKRHFENVVW